MSQISRKIFSKWSLSNPHIDISGISFLVQYLATKEALAPHANRKQTDTAFSQASQQTDIAFSLASQSIGAQIAFSQPIRAQDTC